MLRYPYEVLMSAPVNMQDVIVNLFLTMYVYQGYKHSPQGHREITKVN